MTKKDLIKTLESLPDDTLIYLRSSGLGADDAWAVRPRAFREGNQTVVYFETERGTHRNHPCGHRDGIVYKGVQEIDLKK